MISRRGKRKLTYEGENFWWFVRVDSTGAHRIHIISEDKKVYLKRPFLDTEVPVTPAYVKKLLEEYFRKYKAAYAAECEMRTEREAICVSAGERSAGWQRISRI